MIRKSLLAAVLAVAALSGTQAQAHSPAAAPWPVWAMGGGVLIVFDRLFGTYIEEKEDVPCEYGLVTPVKTHNPIAINFMPWVGLAKDVASARSLREAWNFLFAPPGWRPDGQGLTTAEIRKAHAAMT